MSYTQAYLDTEAKKKRKAKGGPLIKTKKGWVRLVGKKKD